MAEKGLGRLPATDDRHIRLYGLTAQTMPTVPTPVVLGTNWYQAFDDPQPDKDGVYWLGGKKPGWGPVRGGHCYCLKPKHLRDLVSWWQFYDQGEEGACVGFGWSRYASLTNRKRYDGFKLYHEAQKIDEWPGEGYSGTSVRAGGDVLRDQGHWVVRQGQSRGPILAEGIEQNRWATSVEEMAACLDPYTQGQSVLNAGYVTMLNSWGRDWPHYVRIDLEDLQRLTIKEEGEATVVLDRVALARLDSLMRGGEYLGTWRMPL